MKILSIDDHALIRDGLKYVLQELADEVHYLTACDYANAEKIIKSQYDIDLVLLDIGLPDMGGFEALDKIAVQLPTTPIIMLSASESALNVQRAIQKGAQGYIPKSYSQAEMLQVIRQVLNGESFMPTMLQKNESAFITALTARQTQVLTLLARGKSNKQIANELNIATNTVGIHVTTVFKILGVNNRTEAAFLANQVTLSH